VIPGLFHFAPGIAMALLYLRVWFKTEYPEHRETARVIFAGFVILAAVVIVHVPSFKNRLETLCSR
jgi:hypothetical protein